VPARSFTLGAGLGRADILLIAVGTSMVIDAVNDLGRL